MVIGAEENDIRLHQIEQLAHHGGDIAQTGALMRLITLTEQRRYHHLSLVSQTVRIDITDRRGIHQIHLCFAQFFAVCLESARVALQIIFAGELERIHKDRHHDNIRLVTGFFYQCQVAVMQVSHCRDKRNTFAVSPQTGNLFAQDQRSFNNPHQCLLVCLLSRKFSVPALMMTRGQARFPGCGQQPPQVVRRPAESARGRFQPAGTA